MTKETKAVIPAKELTGELKPQPREQETIDEYLKRAKEAKTKIPDIIANGCGFTPYDDMVLYMLICKPKFSEEEMEGVETKVLDMLFEGDIEGTVTDQKLVLITKGDGCKKDMKAGDRIAVRGNPYKITTPKGTFLAVREYDVIGKYE